MSFLNFLIEVIEDILKPQKTWGEFTRKMISLTFLVSVALIGYNTFRDYQTKSGRFIPLHEVVQVDPHAFDAVKQTLKDVRSQHPFIQAMWLYSWPDAANVELVHTEGVSMDPMPVGHFWKGDAEAVGHLTLDICTQLKRNIANTACAIIGNDDAWGLLIVVWDPSKTRPPDSESIAEALAHRVSRLIYKDSI